MLNKITSLIITLTIIKISSVKIRTKCIENLLKSKTKNKKCLIRTYDTSGNIIQYVKACKRGKICYEGDYNYGYCGKYTNPLVIGDKSKTDQECLSGNRKGKRCRGLGDGAYCKDSSQCDRNYYCSFIDNTCRINDDYCFSDEQCEIFKVCTFNSTDDYNEGKGKCVDIGSIEIGKFSVNKWACESGYSIYDKDNKGFICAEIISKDKYCYNNNFTNLYSCNITVNTGDGNVLYSNYVCNTDEKYLDVNGNAVCLNNGYSNSFKKYLSVLKNLKKKVKVNKSQGFPNVNDRRFHGENKNIKKAYFYVKYYQFAGKENDEEYNCIVDYFIRQYLNSGFLKFRILIFIFSVFLLF